VVKIVASSPLEAGAGFPATFLIFVVDRCFISVAEPLACKDENVKKGHVSISDLQERFQFSSFA